MVEPLLPAPPLARRGPQDVTRPRSMMVSYKCPLVGNLYPCAEECRPSRCVVAEAMDRQQNDA